MKTDITLSLDAALVRDLETLAARKGMSLSSLMATELESLVCSDQEYEVARQRSLARLERGFDLGWTPTASRAELHLSERQPSPTDSNSV